MRQSLARAAERHALKARRRRRTARRKAGASRPRWLADEALALLLAEYDFETVLDIGCGDGTHARLLSSRGKRVTTISLERYGDFEPTFVGDFLQFNTPERFDVVWCSHVLEHQTNVGFFLRRLIEFAKPGGILALTVPPARSKVVGGHVTLWNTGLLLYNAILAGLDCSEARTKEYGYNVSLIVRKRMAELPPLRHDAGDIERLSRYFPIAVREGFNGNVPETGWTKQAPRTPPVGEPVGAERLDAAHFLAWQTPFSTDLEALVWAAQRVQGAGHVMEFGVFTGRSIRELAAIHKTRTVHGFDSFEGLPVAWRRSPTSTYAPGHFRTDPPGEVPSNVRIWKGRFAESLRAWLEKNAGSAAFVHIDCDVYESAVEVLELLNDRIVADTIIVFDELCDWKESGRYSFWRDGEWRALREWLEKYRRAVRVLCRGPDYSAAVTVGR